jgi:site-specific recombinase XerD
VSALAPTLQSFFTDYLVGQRGASAHTITSYRDTFRLLLGYLNVRTGVAPSTLEFTDLNVEHITGFLTMLEEERANSPRTRNARLAAIHSFFNYATLRHLEHAELIARVLAIPPKNTRRSDVTYLSDLEVEALLAAPDRTTWTGRRDHALLLVLVTTGLRVSELNFLTRTDVCTERHAAHVVCHGKGRKDRITPLDSVTAKILRIWVGENVGLDTEPLFAARGTRRRMTTDAVAQRVKLHSATAASACPSLVNRNVTPHVLRHTCAMRMLAAGLDATTISLWLGHESPDSTRPYLHADLALKQRALDRTTPPHTRPGRYSPPDKLVAFLEAL